METILKTIRQLAIVVWVGGITFFAFVLAPTVFSPSMLERLHGTALPGAIVAATLARLNVIGLVCGLLFAAATAVLFRRAPAATRGRYEIQILLAVLMLAATAYLKWNVIPAMEHDRALAGGDIQSAPPGSYPRTHFDKLHTRSERAESLVLLCGLAIVVLMARESGLAATPTDS